MGLVGLSLPLVVGVSLGFDVSGVGGTASSTDATGLAFQGAGMPPP